MHACLLQATGHCSLREMKQQGLHDHPKHTCCACRLYLLHCWLLLVSFPVSGWPCWSQKYPEIAKIRGFNVDIGRGRWLHTGRVRARWLRVGAGMCVRGTSAESTESGCCAVHARRCRDVDYGDLNRELRKIITKDNNVAVVAEAVHCTGALAKGLRQAYSGTAKGLVEVSGTCCVRTLAQTGCVPTCSCMCAH